MEITKWGQILVESQEAPFVRKTWWALEELKDMLRVYDVNGGEPVEMQIFDNDGLSKGIDERQLWLVNSTLEYRVRRRGSEWTMDEVAEDNAHTIFKECRFGLDDVRAATSTVIAAVALRRIMRSLGKTRVVRSYTISTTRDGRAMLESNPRVISFHANGRDEVRVTKPEGITLQLIKESGVKLDDVIGLQERLLA